MTCSRINGIDGYISVGFTVNSINKLCLFAHYGMFVMSARTDKQQTINIWPV